MSVYSLGLGLPFVLICAGASSLLNRLSWFTAHQRVVNLVVGLFIVIIGFLLMADLFTRLSNALAF
jgi:cytochrome c-type biogenesis protein